MSDAVGQAKQHTTGTRDRLLKTFSFVPDDKLTWSPSPTARTPLRLVAHAAVSNNAFAGILRGEPFRANNPRELAALAAAEEEKITSREQAVALLKETTDNVLSALDSLTPEQTGSVVETPFFSAPMAFWMNLPGRHMDNHASQIDYIQTCWGDMDWHM